jgi:hypothetical protein
MMDCNAATLHGARYALRAGGAGKAAMRHGARYALRANEADMIGEN